MSEYPSEDATDQPAEQAVEPEQERAESVRTGVPEVDEVLESVDDLEDTPVDGHVAVFEDAHDRLRRALDSRPDA